MNNFWKHVIWDLKSPKLNRNALNVSPFWIQQFTNDSPFLLLQFTKLLTIPISSRYIDISIVSIVDYDPIDEVGHSIVVTTTKQIKYRGGQYNFWEWSVVHNDQWPQRCGVPPQEQNKINDQLHTCRMASRLSVDACIYMQCESNSPPYIQVMHIVV
jgi:hypothetical protein